MIWPYLISIKGAGAIGVERPYASEKSACNSRRTEKSFAPLAARHISFVHDAQKILHVMPDLVRDHISTRKVPGRAKAVGEFLEERKMRYTLRSRGQ
jgi:hypothetical protein